MYDVFISYSVWCALTADGLTCFIDRTGIDGGADFPIVLTQAILDSRLLLFVASKHSYESDFTQKELTFAVSNKGSSFIFPLIIDGEPLPKNLEFLLSNINWRTLSSSYRIEKEMLAEVHKRLEDPRAGQTLEMRRSNTLARTIILVAVLAVAAVGAIFYFQDKRTEAAQTQQEKAETMALEAGEQFTQLLSDARGNLSKAKVLSAQENPMGTFDSELALLQAADSLVKEASSLSERYIAKRKSYANFFNLDDLRRTADKVGTHRDSMFNFWRDRAKDIYGRSYTAAPDLFRDFLSDILDKATRIKEYEELENIKMIINQSL